jgi:accessory gene regulator protein AgrB
MLDKLQLFLKSKIGQPYAYYITCVVYLIGTFSGLTIIGYIFGVWWQVLLIGALISLLRSYTMGFHCHTNGKCFIASTIIIVMFSLISQAIPLWIVFLLGIYSCADIYKNAPVELNPSHDDKDKDWHFKRIVLIITICLAVSLIAYYFSFFEICKCILLSIVMTDLLLFKNDKLYI